MATRRSNTACASKVARRVWTIPELAAALDPPRHPDTLIKARRFKSTRPGTARALEEVTGISRIRFLWPDEYGDPWSELLGE